MFQGATVSWCSKKQQIVALSYCESEYVTGAVTACQAMWLNSLLEELKQIVEKPIKLWIDNKSAISLSMNPVSQGRSKHIETKFHFLREQVEKGIIEVCYCSTLEQFTDILTKAVKTEQFIKLRNKLGVLMF